MALAKVRYVGARERFRVILPYPHVSISAKTGEVVFKKSGEEQFVDEDSAINMSEISPNLFELVPDQKKKEN